MTSRSSQAEGAARVQEPASSAEPNGPDAAAYIADFAHQLAGIARQSGLGFLAHLLELAQVEAEKVAGTDRRAADGRT